MRLTETVRSSLEMSDELLDRVRYDEIVVGRSHGAEVAHHLVGTFVGASNIASMKTGEVR